MKLFQVDTVDEARIKIQKYFGDIILEEEELAISQCLGRMAARDIFSPINLPEFNRSTVDGYGIKAVDTFGASDALPVFLKLIGEVTMGQSTSLTLSPGEAVYVPTGGMIPKGVDAMAMLEYVEVMDEKTIALHRPAAPGENMMLLGEDIKKGEVLISQGQKIKPQDIGALAGVGIEKIRVFQRPQVAIISTGDEIVASTKEVPWGKIRDINTYALVGQAKELGLDITFHGVVSDDYQALQEQINSLLPYNHLILVSGGSSVGYKDITAKVFNSLGSPGIFVHGLAIKPGKPTIMAKCGQTALFGLPGHPVSAMIVFRIFISYLVRLWQGAELAKSGSRHSPIITAQATANIHAAPGKETYQLVYLTKENRNYLAHPIHGKSGAISLMTRAHGYVTIEHNREGIKKGEIVMVTMF